MRSLSGGPEQPLAQALVSAHKRLRAAISGPRHEAQRGRHKRLCAGSDFPDVRATSRQKAIPLTHWFDAFQSIYPLVVFILVALNKMHYAREAQWPSRPAECPEKRLTRETAMTVTFDIEVEHSDANVKDVLRCDDEN